MKKKIIQIGFIMSILINISLSCILLYVFDDIGCRTYFVQRYLNSKNNLVDSRILVEELYESYNPENPEIVMVGDSLTEGVNWSELVGNKVIGRGIHGDKVTDILKRIDKVTVYKPKKIFIMAGVNDISGGYSVDEMIMNYQSLISKIVKDVPETEIYIQSILPVNTDIKYYRSGFNNAIILEANKKLEELANDNNCIYIDLYNHFIDEGKLKAEYTNDGLHLTSIGYRLWRQLLSTYTN